MASQFYTEVLLKGLKASGTKVTQKAILEVASSMKALDLTTTLALRSGEEISETTRANFIGASEKYVKNLVDSRLNGSLDDILGTDFDSSDTDTVEIESVYGIRDSRGKMMSALSLASLLNMVLYKFVEPLMDTPALVWRTGRLAHSGRITKITPGAGGRLSPGSIMFTYMLAPYEVFEPGSGSELASPARSPTALFTEAIKNALASILSPTSTQFNIEGPF